MTTAGKRLKILRNKLKLTQAQFGERVGLEWYQIKDMESDKVQISPVIAKVLYHEYGINAEWLLTGQGDMSFSDLKKVSSETCPCIEDFSFISKFFAQPAGGPGSYVLSQDVEQQYAFKTTWLKKRCQPNQCGLFTVRGNSMLPSIGDGDLVLVDMSKKELRDIIDGQIYAFTEGDLMKVKRLVKKGSKIIAISDNKAEIPDPMEVDMEQFRLIGRVIWVGHEYKIE